MSTPHCISCPDRAYNPHKAVGTSTPKVNPWQIGHFINPKCDLIFELNVRNTNISSIIRHESFRIDSRDSEEATAQRKFLSPSGKESIEKRRRHDVCCTKREY